MVLEILRVEPIYPQYSGVLETSLALRYWFFEVLGSESVNAIHREINSALSGYQIPENLSNSFAAVFIGFNGVRC